MELERPQSIQCVTYAQFCGHKANTRSIANAWQTLLKNTWPPDLMWGQERGGYVSYHQIPVHKMVVQIILWLQCIRHLSFHSGYLNSNTYIPNNTKKVRVGTFWKKRRSTAEGTQAGIWRKKCCCFLKNIFEAIVGGIEIFLTPSKIFFAVKHTFSQEKLRYISKKSIDNWYWSKPSIPLFLNPSLIYWYW